MFSESLHDANADITHHSAHDAHGLHDNLYGHGFYDHAHEVPHGEPLSSHDVHAAISHGTAAFSQN